MPNSNDHSPDQAAKEKFMRRAIEMAYEAMNSGKGRPFGAVIVKDGEIVAEGHNEVLHRMDITAHAETVTIGKATKALGRLDLSDCEIYVNGVPCPMCMTAIYWSRLGKLYYGADQEDAVAIGFDDTGFYEDLKKPLNERALPVEQIDSMRDEARACYNAWAERKASSS